MFERTVNFDDKNSWTDFNIVFKSLTIGSPEPQLILIDVPFRNGSLDETDYFGDVKYKDRPLSMEFLIPWTANDHHEIYSKVLNELHGRRKKIVYSADQGWRYEGRLQVGDLSHDGDFWAFSIDGTVDPYKYRDISTVFTVVENGTEFKVLNDEMKTVPTITTTGPLTLTFEGKNYLLSKGTVKIDDIVLKKGENVFTVSDFSNIVKIQIAHTEGRL